MRVRIVIELDPEIPLDHLNDWVKELRKMRFVKDAYIEKKEDWEQFEHNTMIAELLEKLAELDIDNEKKDELMLIALLGMKAEDGEFVFDKVVRALEGAREEDWEQ